MRSFYNFICLLSLHLHTDDISSSLLGYLFKGSESYLRVKMKIILRASKPQTVNAVIYILFLNPKQMVVLKKNQNSDLIIFFLFYILLFLTTSFKIDDLSSFLCTFKANKTHGMIAQRVIQ